MGGVIDPYQVLGVARDASVDEIRAAYRRLARQHHPDLNPGADTARFRAVHEAYRSLGGGQRAPGEDDDGPPSAPGRTSPSPPGPAQPVRRFDLGRSTEPATGPLPAASVLLTLAVVGCAPGPLLLCGLLLAPAGAVLGHVARRRAVRDGRPGAGLALVGIVAGWAMTVVMLTAITVGVLVSRG